MGFFKNFYEFVKGRLNKNVEVISKNFGAMAILWSAGLFSSLIALATGLPPNWGVTLALGLGGTSEFVIILFRTMFGKPNKEKTTDN